MPPIPSLAAARLERLAETLANEVSHASLEGYFGELGIRETPGSRARWRRILDALAAKQAHDRCANNVVRFVELVLDPARYVREPGQFDSARASVNEILSFDGLHVAIDGKVRSVAPARTIDEARERAGRLRAELERRHVHDDVLAFCRAELLQENYFHAVFEATKSVAEKIRRLTGLTLDGTALVDRAFGRNDPLLAVNSLRTDTEWSDQNGVANLLRGVFGAFRNVTAHAPKITWEINEQDAFDLLTIVSYLHRRLASAVRIPRSVPGA
jgi:uncharacterized protein (TIGR02391 family)